MKHRAILWASIAGAASGAVIGCVALAPALWLANGISEATAGRVQLTNAQGTVWHGSAAIALSAGPGSATTQTLPTRIQWRIKPGLGRIHLQLHAQCCTAVPLSARLGVNRVEVDAAHVAFPLAIVQGLGTPWNSLGVAGRANLRWEKVVVSWNEGETTIAGKVQADVVSASTKLTTLPEIGSYRVVVDGGDKPQLALTTQEGALQLSGHGRWVAGKFSFDGWGYAQPGNTAALANLLTLIGERSGDKTKIRFGQK